MIRHAGSSIIMKLFTLFHAYMKKQHSFADQIYILIGTKRSLCYIKDLVIDKAII